MDRFQLAFNGAEDSVLRAEVALKSVKNAIENLDREIGILSVVIGNLIANVNALKSKEIITLASLYKKALLDLDFAKTRRNVLIADREKFLAAKEKAEQVLRQAKESYRLALKKLKDPHNNVLKGKFGRR